jgi:hypothetical protein
MVAANSSLFEMRAFTLSSATAGRTKQEQQRFRRLLARHFQ